MSTSKKLLIYGGNGALGSFCVEYFKGKGWWICSVGLRPNDLAHQSIVVNDGDSLQSQADVIKGELNLNLNSNEGSLRMFSGVLCFAGGWAGGTTKSKDFLKNCDMMWSQSVKSSLVATNISSEYLEERGILVLTGSRAALDITGSIPYLVAKAAVHHLTLSLKDPKAGLPKEAIGVALLPATLDTPNNRKWMKNADFSTWTPLEHIAKKVESWLEGTEARPECGSLIDVITKNGETDFVNCSPISEKMDKAAL